MAFKSLDDLARSIQAFNDMLANQAAAVAFTQLTDTFDATFQAMPRFATPPGSFSAPKRPRPSQRIDAHTELAPGTVAFTRGPGTYGARYRLKAYGGRWHPDVLGGVWIIAAEHADAAEANIRLAERTGMELPLDDDPNVPVEKITCYVCGRKYSLFEMRVMKHAVAEDWFCGCSERNQGPPPRTARVRTR